MALLKTRCPECNAGLKSPTGFAVGQTVCCPKCETYFAVEEPEEAEGEEPKKAPAGTKGKRADAPAAKKTLKATVADDDDDDDDDAPKKQKKKKKVSYDEDEEGTQSYKNSPLRFVILGVLVVVMLVMGYFLYDKRKKEKAAGGGDTSRDEAAVVNPRVADQNGPKLQPIQPGLVVGGPKQPNPGGKGGAPAVPFGLGGGPALTPAQAQAQMQKFKTALVGTWVADLGGGVTEELTYTATGTFTTKLTGPAPATLTAKYTIKELVGTKGVKIQLDTGGGTRTVTATFEDDELQHPTLQPGVTGTFRKK